MLAWLSKLLADPAGLPDEARVSAMLLVLAFIGLAGWNVIVLRHAFDMQQFGVGAGRSPPASAAGSDSARGTDMAILFTLLRKFWWVIPLAAAAAFGAWERHEVQVQTAKADKLEQQVGADAQTIKQLRTGIQAQNAAVERILAQGRANVAAAKAQDAQRVQAATKVQVVYRTRIQTIEAAPVPQECSSAAAWAASQAQGLAQGWNK
jgi:hypothetical protein